MKESMKDYNYPQGVAPSAKVEGGIDDKKMMKKKPKKKKVVKKKPKTDMYGVPISKITTRSAFERA